MINTLYNSYVLKIKLSTILNKKKIIVINIQNFVLFLKKMVKPVRDFFVQAD